MMLAALENLHGCAEEFLYNRTSLPCAVCLTNSVVCKAVIYVVRDCLNRERRSCEETKKVYGRIDETKKCIRGSTGRTGPIVDEDRQWYLKSGWILKVDWC